MMNIADVMNTKGVHISCEVFPPKAFAQLDDARLAVGGIASQNPAFMSVTYGAGGTAAEYTLEIARHVQACGIEPLAHLTCVNSTRDKVRAVLDSLEQAHITNVLALRGDRVEGVPFPEDGGFPYASELIQFIRARGGFCVGAACYPEGHPESGGKAKDLEYLKRKVDAGAQFLVTQMCFDNNVMYNFMYRALQKHVDIPIAAGIMPVIRASQVKRICALSGASLPPRFLSILDRFADSPAAMKQAGIAYATEQIIDLIANGVENIHIYVMNKTDVAEKIFSNLSDVIAHG